MEGRRVLADTSLFIEHLRARDKTATTLYRLTRSVRIETCAIVAAEIFYGARTVRAEQQARSVLQPFIIHPFTAEMAGRQCAVMQGFAEVNCVPDIRDVMIAATALELSLPVATLNRRHFERLSAIELISSTES